MFLQDSMENDSENDDNSTSGNKKTESDELETNSSVTTVVEDEFLNHDQASTSRAPSNRFMTTRKKLRPPNRNDMILNELKADRKIQEEQFSCFKDHLKKTEDQREKFLNIFERAFLKRKRGQSSSDSD